MIYGYARTSTDDQNIDLQISALKKLGCDRIFKDGGVSGATIRRASLETVMKLLEEGDTLAVWKLDRLGRSLKDILYLLDKLHESGVAFVSVTENIDTNTPMGKAMMQMTAVFAELERSMIAERTKAGLKEAVARGVKLGRKEKLSYRQAQAAKEMIESGKGVSDVAALFNVDRTTLYRKMKALETASDKQEEHPFMTEIKEVLSGDGVDRDELFKTEGSDAARTSEDHS